MMCTTAIKAISERIGTMTERLQSRGWWEVCPTQYAWRYVKNGWMCTLEWYTGRIEFYRIGGNR